MQVILKPTDERRIQQVEVQAATARECNNVDSDRWRDANHSQEIIAANLSEYPRVDKYDASIHCECVPVCVSAIPVLFRKQLAIVICTPPQTTCRFSYW